MKGTRNSAAIIFLGDNLSLFSMVKLITPKTVMDWLKIQMTDVTPKIIRLLIIHPLNKSVADINTVLCTLGLVELIVFE